MAAGQLHVLTTASLISNEPIVFVQFSIVISTAEILNSAKMMKQSAKLRISSSFSQLTPLRERAISYYLHIAALTVVAGH